ADAAPVPQRRLELLELGLLRFVVSKRLRIPDGVVRDAAEVPILQLVVPEAPQRKPGALLHHHDGEAASRELAGDDPAGRAGTDDDEVDGVGVLEGLRRHFRGAASTTKPG